jgi:hypothetical protein
MTGIILFVFNISNLWDTYYISGVSVSIDSNNKLVSTGNNNNRCDF